MKWVDGVLQDQHRFDCSQSPCDCGFDFRTWANEPDGDVWIAGLHNVKDVKAMLAAFVAGQRSILSRAHHPTPQAGEQEQP
jgi:hypothetical protein